MSNIQQIEKSLKNLLEEENPFVAMISGEWGIGKTYFWKELVKGNKRVAYISLFGHNSLDDIKTTIMTEVGVIQHKKLKTFHKRVEKLQIEFQGVSIGVGGIFSMFTRENLEDITICFDDFERLSNNLDLKDVLGLISYLKEERNCKIIMILNENELDTEIESQGQSRSEIFAKKKEKVVDYSFHFIPSYDESFEIIHGDIEYFKAEWIKNFFIKMQLKNIRIMKQAINQLNHFVFIKEYKLDDKILDEFVKIALNLFVFNAKCNMSYSKYVKIKDYKFKRFMHQNNKDFDFKKNIEYEQCINYQILEFDTTHNKENIEEVVYHFISTHIINKVSLKNLLEDNNKNVHYYAIREKILLSVNDYLYNFKIDDNKISQEIKKIIINHQDEIHHIYDYAAFKSIKQRHLLDYLDDTIEKIIIQNYLQDYPNSADPIYNSHLNIDLIKEDYEWAEEFINGLNTKFKGKEISIDEIKDIMQKFITDESFDLLDSPPKLNSISIDQYKSFIHDDMKFVELLIRFLSKHPLHHEFKIDIAIESIKKALQELKNESDVYSRKIDYIVEEAKIKLST